MYLGFASDHGNIYRFYFEQMVYMYIYLDSCSGLMVVTMLYSCWPMAKINIVITVNDITILVSEHETSHKNNESIFCVSSAYKYTDHMTNYSWSISENLLKQNINASCYHVREK